MNRLLLLSLCLVAPAVVALLHADDKKDAKPDDAGFVSIFDGKTLRGWHASAKTGHSAASKHQSGGKWVVEDGAIVGSQDIPGNGGILITDQEYGDFEVVLEMKNDFGPDSGLFLRSNDKGQAYQAMIDYHANGNLMGIYGEGLSGGINVLNFKFLDEVTKIKKVDCPFPLPVSPEKWPEFWKHGEWNELRARIRGNPPSITTWIKGVKFMEFTDKEKRHPDKGGIALQVHGGGDYTKQFVRYRNIRVKELK
jgi:3-keto-disaccharide hydrolase